MKKLPYIKSLFVVSLLFCKMDYFGCFAAPVSEPRLKTFHNVSVLPHTGQMQYNVELHRINDVDFDWPVSITYTSDGFRPFDYSDPVGSGWTLHAGGVITRQIMGKPDDQKFGPNGIEYGFYAMLKSDIASSYYKFHDCQSDIYTFSFAGYSGSFIIDWNGEVTLLSGDFVDVDLSEMTIQDEHIYQFSAELVANYIPQSSTIHITTNNGWQYTFVGLVEALEYTCTQVDNSCNYPIITAWHLTSVQAPNGRKLSFHYMPITASDALNQFHMDIDYTAYYLPDGDFYSRREAPFYSNSIDYYHLMQYKKEEYRFMYPYQTYTRIPRLDSITTSKGLLKASFNYSTLPHALYSDKKTYNRQKSFLASLQITADKKDVGNWQFTYDKIENQIGNDTISHWYLTQLQGSETVLFKYQYDWSEAIDVAKINTIDSIDLYGYSISHPAYGLLRQSHEPTGSTTTYSYTPCKYDSLRIFKKTGDRILSVLIQDNERKMFHAQSISSIKVTDAMGQLLLHKYYIYDDAPDMAESMQMANIAPNGTVQTPGVSIPNFNLYGVLNIDYALINDTADTYANGKTYTLFPVLRLHSPYFTPLEYGKVIEKVHYGNESNPSVTHIYHYGNTIDLYEYNGKLDINYFTDAFPYLLQWERRSRLHHKQEYIGRAKQLKHESYYEYTLYPVPQPKSDSVTQYITRPPFRSTTMRVGACNITIPIVPPVLLSTEDYEIESNGTLQQTVYYQRDTLQRIVREDTEDGNRHKFVRYTYPDNLFQKGDAVSDAIMAGYAGLVEQYRIGNPVETVSGFVRDDNEYITHGEITLYEKYVIGGTIVPPYNPPDHSDSVVYMMESTTVRSAPDIGIPTWYAPKATLSLQTTDPLADYVPLSVQGGKVCADSRYDTTAVYNYNRSLRMTQMVPRGGIAVNYEWDSNGLYCIKESTGNQQVTYTYYPYIGIATETDPRGVTTYYAYDTLGRLTEVWRMVNGKKQIINAWNYHYATEE